MAKKENILRSASSRDMGREGGGGRAAVRTCLDREPAPIGAEPNFVINLFSHAVKTMGGRGYVTCGSTERQTFMDFV